MRVYRMVNDVNRYQYFLPENENEWEKLIMDCTPRAESWVPPEVFVYKPRHKVGDFYQFGSSALITSPRATEALRTQLEMAGELLPLPYEGQIFTVLNVTECINCLDQEKTEWAYAESTGDKVHIAKYAFHPNRFSESEIFKIPETYKGEILLVEGLHDPEEEFRHVVQQYSLKGLILEELWSDE